MFEGSSDSKMDAFSCNSVAMISRRVPQHMSEVLQEFIRRRLHKYENLSNPIMKETKNLQ
jgi:hypothetical protein